MRVQVHKQAVTNLPAPALVAVAGLVELRVPVQAQREPEVQQERAMAQVLPGLVELVERAQEDWAFLPPPRRLQRTPLCQRIPQHLDHLLRWERLQ